MVCGYVSRQTRGKEYTYWKRGDENVGIRDYVFLNFMWRVFYGCVFLKIFPVFFLFFLIFCVSHRSLEKKKRKESPLCNGWWHPSPSGAHQDVPALPALEVGVGEAPVVGVQPAEEVRVPR